ncbi:hypothetical protein [Vreelandella stevensii]|uniref:hypothetical protein n=1 Tax=Vreelandella stevensii TaxID=502821 RepID=UPI00403AC865
MGKKDMNSDEKAEFSTSDLLHDVYIDIKRNQASLLKNGADPREDAKLLSVCIEVLDYVNNNFLGLINNDGSKIWQEFLTRWRPRFSNYTDFVRQCFLLLATVEAIEEEVALAGSDETLTKEMYRQINSVHSFYSADYKDQYERFKVEYEKRIKLSMLEERALIRFREFNKESIAAELKDLKEEKERISMEFSQAITGIKAEISETNGIVTQFKNDASLTVLFKGFSDYAEVMRHKVHKLTIEKYSWMALLAVLIIWNAINDSFVSLEWKALIPMGAGAIFILTMLKVNLKKLDQYEQITAKVEHKLAVSLFYKNEMDKESKVRDVSAIDNEYYRFLFSEIETTEWNTPDIANDISKILKSYKK